MKCLTNFDTVFGGAFAIIYDQKNPDSKKIFLAITPQTTDHDINPAAKIYSSMRMISYEQAQKIIKKTVTEAQKTQDSFLLTCH